MVAVIYLLSFDIKCLCGHFGMFYESVSYKSPVAYSLLIDYFPGLHTDRKILSGTSTDARNDRIPSR